MFKKIAIGVAIVGVVGIALTYDKIGVFLDGRKSTLNSTEEAFYFNNQGGLEGLAQLLIEKKIIDDKDAFLNVANYKKLTKERLAAGKYMIEAGESYRNLLNGFTLNGNGNGNAEVEVDVTFNNCKDIYQLAGKVSKCIMLDSTKLVNYLTDGSTLEKFGFTLEQIPALFLPNTYKMYYDTDENQFVDKMAKEFKNFWNADRLAKVKAIGLESPSQVVTLASIVYSEQSKNTDEWPIIAGLYLNRIKQGIKMQSDPTFKFCWGDELKGVQRLLAVHREIDCPYNTYKINGLPPGPIYIPATAVVDACLNRADVDYIYMCAKPDYSGRHNFAVSGVEHTKNATVFQNWLAKELKNQGK
ncbi:MAG: endolytic transglycosylase MltG [Flavobacteriia bacterium]|nr:endolytic transglycosylase MltG [Flavobacteriia bacterium]